MMKQDKTLQGFGQRIETLLLIFFIQREWFFCDAV